MKDIKRILDRLAERNPSVDEDELKRAFSEQVAEDPELLRAIMTEVVGDVSPIFAKMDAGEPLTEDEQARLKALREAFERHGSDD